MGIAEAFTAWALLGLSGILQAAKEALQDVGPDGEHGEMLTRIDSVRHDLQAAANDLTAGVPGAGDRARAAMEAAKALQARLEWEAAQ